MRGAKIEWIGKYFFDATARTYLEGISEELMSAYKRELAHVYRMASAKRMLFIKRKGTH